MFQFRPCGYCKTCGMQLGKPASHNTFPDTAYCDEICYQAYKKNFYRYGQWWKTDFNKMYFYEENIQLIKKSKLSPADT